MNEVPDGMWGDEDTDKFLATIETDRLVEELCQRYPVLVLGMIKIVPDEGKGRDILMTERYDIDRFFSGTNREIAEGIWALQQFVLVETLRMRAKKIWDDVPEQARAIITKAWDQIPSDLRGFDFARLFWSGDDEDDEDDITLDDDDL